MLTASSNRINEKPSESKSNDVKRNANELPSKRRLVVKNNLIVQKLNAENANESNRPQLTRRPPLKGKQLRRGGSKTQKGQNNNATSNLLHHAISRTKKNQATTLSGGIWALHARLQE